jgi:ketosteroid isomerase-like protein
MLYGVAAGRTRYSQALEASDPAAIVAALSDDVIINVAVHDEPLRGKDTAAFLFGVLTQELAPFQLTGEISEGDTSVILFETALRGRRVHGLNVVTYRAGGLAGEVTVFFRPLAALQLVAEVIGGHMAQRFGPPPEGLH